MVQPFFENAGLKQKDIPLCYSSIINRYYFLLVWSNGLPTLPTFYLRHPSCIEIWKSVEVV